MKSLYVVIFLLGLSINAYGKQALTLKHYLDIQLKQNYQIEQLSAQQKAQSLALSIGREYWKPTVTAVAGLQESRSTELGARTSSNQINFGLETTWVSDIGTEVSVNMNHINGENLGAEPLFERQSSQQLTATISQPLLKNNSRYYRQIDKTLAEKQWQQFINSQNRTLLTVYRNALSDFADYQLAYENWLIQQELLNSIKKTTYLVEKMHAVEKATFYELQQARLQQSLQKTVVDQAVLQMNLAQRDALLEVQSQEVSQLIPFSLSQLVILLEKSIQYVTILETHPDYLALSLSYESSQLEAQKEEDSLRPDLDVFYRYQKNQYQTSLSSKEEVYGIRFSYLLTNKRLQQEQAALQAQADNDFIEKSLSLKRLNTFYERDLKNSELLKIQTGVLKAQVELAKVGLEQQRKRYQVGKASYFSLEEVQQEFIDKQVDWIDSQKNLVDSLISLTYYTQFDIRNVL
ncbi:TolC family protein [Marinomonas sp. 2405UD68-3]|uniref:TolC family protein n=1 Tax=Marinomonas sp. 2405UD68-3 TaxID=3391835 RepID=UPI0039C9E8F2